MHIPDNYLSPLTCAALGAAMVPVWMKAIKEVKREISNIKMPTLGVGAAFSFLIMMFNIPLPGGTTGHAVGGTLLAILMGPWAACISITITLLIQAVMFGDGGIIAFGANCFNMAFVLPFSGSLIYRLLNAKIPGEKGNYTAMAAGSYFGINLAALCAAIEFGIQPLLFKSSSGLPLYCPYPLSVSAPAMMIPHLLVAGVAEAMFTVAIYSYVKKVSPDTIYMSETGKTKGVYGLIAFLICLTPIGILAAGTAWGEWDIEEISSLSVNGSALNYVPEGMKNGLDFSAIAPDYSFAGMPASVAYFLSAMVGVAIILIAFKIIAAVKDR